QRGAVVGDAGDHAHHRGRQDSQVGLVESGAQPGDGGGDGVVEVVVDAPDAAAVGDLEIAALPAVEPGLAADVHGVLAERADQRVQAGFRVEVRVVGGLGDLQQLLRAVLGGGDEQGVFVGEVPVQRGPGDADLGGDLVDA